MTIAEYYKCYESKKGCKTIQYPIKLIDGAAKTVGELYDVCINEHVEKIQNNALKWHQMLMRYVEREDAIFWIRRYESSSKKAKADNNGRWPIRRACKTEYDDLSYVFVSNFDAHEILNMVRFVDEPSDIEFAKLMNEHRFPMHYDDGESSDEHYIASYPKIGSTKAGVLTVGHWYLAHILGVNEGYTCPTDFNAMCPRGNLSDWSKQRNFMVRKVAGKFPGNKDLIVAHFLRFIDPLNYYIVPGKNYQDNHGYRFKNNQIGECAVLCDYVAAKYRDIYGETVMDEFRKKVFASPLYDTPTGCQCNIDISYGPNICTKSNSSTGAGTLINQGALAPGQSTTELVLYPSDVKKFKEQLLQRKKAHFVLTYDSGVQKIAPWNANDFKPTSNLRGNITSKTFWRHRVKEGLIKVEAYID